MVHKYSEKKIRKSLSIALELLLKNDFFLLKEAVHERSIAHKLAEYLQIQFPKWNVDCEYNRKGIEPKRLEGIKDCEEDRKTNRIFPDIIIHKRNSDENLFVIEMKKDNPDPKCDIMKLKLLTNLAGDYHYSFGLFINFENLKPKLRWFKDGKESQ